MPTPLPTVQGPQIISAFMEGRAMQMAYKQDQLQQKILQAQVDQLPQQMEMQRQSQALQMMERMAQLPALTGPPKPQTHISPEGQVIEYRSSYIDQQTGQEVPGEAREIRAADRFKPKPTRSLKQGDEIITQEFDDRAGQWNDISSAPRYKPGAAGAQGAAGKPPSGYQWADPNDPDAGLKPIKGGPKDRSQRVKEQADSIGEVMVEIGKAKEAVGYTTAGFLGKPLSNLPGSPAYDLEQRVTTIKANLGFDRLQRMRDASPTGGALGQVAIQELYALQASVASLDAGQSPDQLRENLAKIESHYQRWLDAANADESQSDPAGQSAHAFREGAIRKSRDGKKRQRYQNGQWADF